MADHPIILLLEDCPVTGILLERTILTHLPDCRPIWARTLGEGRERAKGVSIDIFILDIHLPDGSGLDFLFEVSMLYPAARAIVLTASTLPEHEVQSIALGVIHFLKKPVAPPVLVGYLNDLLGFADADPGESFRGTLKDLTPLDLIQLKCLTQANTVMELTSGSQVGRLYFREGNIVHAETNADAGIPALRAIFSWRSGFVRELPIDPKVADTITTPWQNLLMELAHELDQQPQG